MQRNFYHNKFKQSILIIVHELSLTGAPIVALNQAKFIRDEIESLSNEYVSILSTYQSTLKKVLEKSKNIGDANKIDVKISELDKKLKEVKITFSDNLNLYKLNTTFKTLMEY